MALTDQHLREQISKLPTSPGVYQYFDEEGKIIYIGKAKNLKNRVSSYLNKTGQNSKTRVLVTRIHALKYIVVNSEEDALLLENNLIKKYQPRYNILLKDDKSYPWICITREPYPRVFLTRQFSRRGGEFYGPYTSVRFANTLLELIKSMFKLRSCKLALTPQSVCNGKHRVCLEYHIGNCLGPCVAKETQAHYDEQISQIRNILKGHYGAVIDHLNTSLKYCVDNLEFEQAHELKQAIDSLKQYQTKSTIVRSSIHDIDVFSYIDGDKYAYINYLRIVYGSVNQIHTIEIEKKLDETPEELLGIAILEIRQLVNSNSKEIVVPFLPDVELTNLTYTIPKIGDKKELLQLSERNAGFFKLDRERQRHVRYDESKLHRLETLQKELKLPTLPHRIECFDNSNIQGTNPVSSCVVFIDGKPAKSEYRKFHVKTVEGANDFASMVEAVYRRYKRRLEESQPLPDLIVIDGGKGQLGAALDALEQLDLRGKVPIIGLAKRMEEVYFPGDKDPYLIAKNSIALKTLMHIRDEAHRFGITFHRQLRSKGQIKSILSEIEGIGPKTEENLLVRFKTVEGIKLSSKQELAAVIGKGKAEVVYRYFHP
ncbi:MAG: excinuclease ABC subunit UvrC [Marinifilaceae bacterium]